MTLRFHEALVRFLERVRAAQSAELADAGQLVIVRDLWGRLSLVSEKKPGVSLELLTEKLAAAAGPFAGDAPTCKDDLFAPELVFGSPELRPIFDAPGVALLERALTGADWLRGPLPNRDPQPPRATLYGVKGGVGRSTALCAWARYLAKRGKKVLVIDLDLESPGVSSTLLPADQTADYGVLDWLIEDAVGNADETLVQMMAAPSPLGRGMSGSVQVVPCGGSEGRAEYMAKLSRAYLDIPQPGGGVQTFADRLARMLDALEAEHRPDVVLLDSRAGLHDIAAVTITRLEAQVFLFAVGTRQTWDAYETLLSQWRGTSVGEAVRRRIKLVAAQVPEEGRKDYLRRFETYAYHLLADTLYEPSSLTELGAFNFDVHDPSAPHYRLPVYWSRPLQDWNPLDDAVSERQLDAALGDFVQGATELTLRRGRSQESGNGQGTQ